MKEPNRRHNLGLDVRSSVLRDRASRRLVLLLLTLAVAPPGPLRAADEPAASAIEFEVASPPEGRGFAPFYRKHIDLHGFPILASEKTSDYAVKEAAYLVGRMLADRRDILDALAGEGVRLAVMAHSERTTDVPEHRDLIPARFWDRRARGLGATRERPAVSCAEENLLGYPGDPYDGENILIHEFAHAVHEMALARLDPGFDARLGRLYDAAVARGLWKGTYAATNRSEYWAEGVQSHFDANQAPDSQHNHVRTREALAVHDPDLARLISDVFGRNPWRYQPPRLRKVRAHLSGYDPGLSPTFSWGTGPDDPSGPPKPDR